MTFLNPIMGTDRGEVIKYMKYTHFTNEIETEQPKRNRSDFWWWFALVIMVSYFAGHLLLAIIR